jgi:hypothetical protein
MKSAEAEAGVGCQAHVIAVRLWHLYWRLVLLNNMKPRIH